MADKRQKWPQNEIMFQVTQYPDPLLFSKVVADLVLRGEKNFKFTAVLKPKTNTNTNARLALSLVCLRHVSRDTKRDMT